MSTHKKILLFICISFTILPYIWFGDKLFIGGDDTRLFYSYPIEWIKNIASSSWLNFSGLGSYNPQFFILPLLYILSIFEVLGISGFIIQNTAISTILILGFLYLYKLLNFIGGDKYKNESIISSLFFILSPILLLNQFNTFLYAIWLIPLIPITLYYSAKYIILGDKKSILLVNVFGIILALALISIPWLLGFLLPFSITLFMLYIFSKDRKNIFQRFSILICLMILLNSFWLIPFISSFFVGGESYLSSNILSKSTQNTFIPTVESVSYGNTIIYPLLNLFHYNLLKNFLNPSAILYETFYNKVIFLNLIYLLIIFLGLLSPSKNKFRNIHLCFFTGFLISLFLFTVRIGFFYDLFLHLGSIPGFVMFRNFFDKFALGYVFFFSINIYLSLLIIKSNYSYKIYKIIIGFLIISILISSIPFILGLPFKQPLWTTQNIQTQIVIPDEYKNFTKDLKSQLKYGDRILIIPFGISSYSYILGENKNNIFAGRSPIELFTGIQDLSGNLSLSEDKASYFNDMIINGRYDDLKIFLNENNIGFILNYTKLPIEFTNSYLFNQDVLLSQNDIFRKNIFGDLILTSSKGNYELYNVKGIKTNIIEFNNNEKNNYIKYNNVSYKLYINSLLDSDLIFKTSFSKGWKLYLKDTQGLTTAELFKNTHKEIYNYANSWEVDSKTIQDYVITHYSEELQKEGYPKILLDGRKDYKYYIENIDGSIDVELTLYFTPQTYFYIGLIISGITFALLILWLIIDSVRNRRKKK